MFNENDRIQLIENPRIKGTVIEQVDAHVFVELDNGAEMEYLAKQLEPECEVLVAPDVVNSKPSHEPFGPYRPQKGDRRRAQEAIASIRKLYPAILVAANEHIEGFNKLEGFDQVKALSEYTGTPMVVWMGANEFGGKEMMRRVLAKTIINNIATNSPLISDMLIGNIRQALETE